MVSSVKQALQETDSLSIMKGKTVGWVYPRNRRCGISLYAAKFLSALNLFVKVQEVDPVDIQERPWQMLEKLNSCSLVHIQYEPSLFLSGRNDFYKRAVRRITSPLLVTVHEVHRQEPEVFPRNRIRGTWPVRLFKQLRYDYRHPAITAQRHHRSHSFGADKVIVHYAFQKEILIEQGVAPDHILVHAYPIGPKISDSKLSFGTPVHLGATGFITPRYDYDLLFAALERLTVPWRFTWIGGTRPGGDTSTLSTLRK